MRSCRGTAHLQLARRLGRVPTLFCPVLPFMEPIRNRECGRPVTIWMHSITCKGKYERVYFDFILVLPGALWSLIMPDPRLYSHPYPRCPIQCVRRLSQCRSWL